MTHLHVFILWLIFSQDIHLLWMLIADISIVNVNVNPTKVHSSSQFAFCVPYGCCRRIKSAYFVTYMVCIYLLYNRSKFRASDIKIYFIYQYCSFSSVFFCIFVLAISTQIKRISQIRIWIIEKIYWITAENFVLKCHVVSDKLHSLSG